MEKFFKLCFRTLFFERKTRIRIIKNDIEFGQTKLEIFWYHFLFGVCRSIFFQFCIVIYKEISFIRFIFVFSVYNYKGSIVIKSSKLIICNDECLPFFGIN